MEITLKRIYFRDTYTIGAIQVDGKYLMDSLEPRAIDWHKEKKVAGVTAIPEGRYRIGLAYSKTFKRMMPYLKNVPEFTGVMIHTGNTAKNTRGCILVGKNTTVGALSESRIHFNRLYPQIEDAIKSGQEVWLTVRSIRGWTY